MLSTHTRFKIQFSARSLMILLVCLVGLLAVMPVHAARFTLNVVDDNGVAVEGFRWQVEEDVTFNTAPGTSSPDSLSFGFHKSYFPIARKTTGEPLKGEVPGSSITVQQVKRNKRYYVSVLPYTGHSLGGAPLIFPASGPANVTVVVNSNPIPTAQITVFVFEDNKVLNGAPDLPEEDWDIAGGTSPAQDFSIKVFDAAGQYGIAGGQVTQDAFGNTLGTEYDAAGNVTFMPPNGFLLQPNANGVLAIKNMPPAKYAIEVVPPAGQGWHQTSTIEGSKAIDAWVKANEPPFFIEFGPPGHHVFIGFVQDQNNFAGGSGSTISGEVTNLHLSRPTDTAFFSGNPFPACRIGLNDGPTGVGEMVYTAACEDTNGDGSRSEFSISNVPPGTYDLVVYDDNMNVLIATRRVIVNPNGTCDTPDGLCDLGDVSVFNWFARFESSVFFDFNENGFRDCVTPDCDNFSLGDEVNLGADQAAVTLRFRDGRVYQSFPVDVAGEAPFDTVFPFFHWLVAEVDFAKLKATGATFTIDNGGPVAAGETLTPQPQVCTTAQSTNPDDPDFGCTVGSNLVNPNTLDNLSRTETGPVLTAGFQGFLGQTNRTEFGKTIYGPNENGGISGIVFYAITRAEDDPRFAAAEEWEPGVPRVQVNLYRDADLDGVIDDRNGNGALNFADIDNYPFNWSTGSPTQGKGPEDINRTGGVNRFNRGDAIRITYTDSFDDSVPAGCQGDVFIGSGQPTDCFDGLRNFNQMRPGVFNGGYAFGPDDGPQLPGDPNALYASTYIVEAVTPPGLEHIKEEDKNVDFGDEFTPSPLLLPPICVGDERLVPQFLSLQTTEAGLPIVDPGDLIESPGYDPAGLVGVPLCDRKQIKLSNGQNAATDFFMYSKTPKSAHVVGGILNDLGNEFDPNSPNFSEKFAPPWLPVAFYDWQGTLLNRVHADEFGKFNALLPSTYTVNVPSPSGVSPNMITACMNDAGQVPNEDHDPTDPGSSPTIIDPFFDKQYSQFCYTFQYMPAGTTYLDTPVLPVSAFAGPGNPLDCEPQHKTPLIARVTARRGTGPSILNPNGGPYAAPGDLLVINSAGIVKVPNPEYTGPGGPEPRLINRNYNFGAKRAASKVTLGGRDLNLNCPNCSWSGKRIVAKIQSNFATQVGSPGFGSHQLMVTRAGGVPVPVESPMGVTVTVDDQASPTRTVHHVVPSALPEATPIQDAIDAAGAGDLILVESGNYNEIPIMYKPVQIQGWGAFSTTLNGRKVPGEKLQAWRDKVAQLEADREFDLLPGQENIFNLPDNEPTLLFDGEGAGITVVAHRGNTKTNSFTQALAPRIDGVTITGADHGGGIFVSGYADWLEISNNRLISNQGVFGGGVRVGYPTLTAEVGNNLVHTDARNDNISIHHNHVAQNGTLDGAGGGIALYTGADRYTVTDNFVCGNFAQAPGGGIGHLGLSTRGLIEDNSIIFNQSFDQAMNVNGGGIAIVGKAGLNGNLTTGSGIVDIVSNLILGNQAGAGDGGGIALENINGQDVAGSTNSPGPWYRIDILNNMITNNMAGDAAGGISLQEAIKVNIINNTIANNDSTATVGSVLIDNGNASTPQPAGIVSHGHVNMPAVSGVPARYLPAFSNPLLRNNIVWHNRSFTWDGPNLQLLPDIAGGDPAVYDDLGIIGAAGALDPRFSILTDTAGTHGSNLNGDPQFVREYVNGDRNLTIFQQEPTTGFDVAGALDEGGNFIDIRFGPLTLVDPATGDSFGDYHITSGSPAIDEGLTSVVFSPSFPELRFDFDDETRHQGADADIGADELQ